MPQTIHVRNGSEVPTLVFVIENTKMEDCGRADIKEQDQDHDVLCGDCSFPESKSCVCPLADGKTTTR